MDERDRPGKVVSWLAAAVVLAMGATALIVLSGPDPEVERARLQNALAASLRADLSHAGNAAEAVRMLEGGAMPHLPPTAYRIVPSLADAARNRAAEVSIHAVGATSREFEIRVVNLSGPASGQLDGDGNESPAKMPVHYHCVIEWGQ